MSESKTFGVWITAASGPIEELDFYESVEFDPSVSYETLDDPAWPVVEFNGPASSISLMFSDVEVLAEFTRMMNDINEDINGGDTDD